MNFYSLSGYDNDSYMCASTEKILDECKTVPFCPECGYKTEQLFVSPDFKAMRRTYDFSYTYDGYCIVSRKFKEACLRFELTGAGFLDLLADQEFFVLAPSAIVTFDSERRHTRFEGFCKRCCQYRAVAGATPAYLKAFPTHDISRTDVLFGSGNEKHPLIITSQKAKDILTQKKLKGLLFKDAVVK